MDLTNLLANSDLLKQLAVEFKQLKKSPSGGTIDYNAWMRARLRDLRAKDKPALVHRHADEGVSPDQSGAAPYAPALPLPGQQLQQPGHGNQPQSGSQPTSGTQLTFSSGAQPPVVPRHGLVSSQLQAAAERDRRLALSAALARQHITLGIAPPTVALRASTEHMHPGGSDSSASAGADAAVLEAARKMTEQQQSVLQLVTNTQQQLDEHKALLLQVAQTVAAVSAAVPSCGSTAIAAPQEGHTILTIPASETASQQAPQERAEVCAEVAPGVSNLQPNATGSEQPVHPPQPQRPVPAAWFLPPDLHSKQGSRWQGPVPMEPLHVIKACSPDGKVRKSRQERKQELKAALKRVLFTDPVPVGTDVDTRADAAGPAQSAWGQTDEQHVRATLMQLLGRGGRQQRTADIRHQLPAQQHAQSFRQQAAPPHHMYPGGPAYVSAQDIAALEEEAAHIVQSDLRHAHMQAGEQRLSQLEAQLQSAVVQLQQQADRLGRLASSGAQGQPPAEGSCSPAAVQQSKSAAPPHSSQHAGTAAESAQDPVLAPAPENPQLTLQRMLTELQRMEQTEASIRQRWLGRSGAPGTAQALVSQDGVVTSASQTVPQSPAPLPGTLHTGTCVTQAIPTANTGTCAVASEVPPVAVASAHQEAVTREIVDHVQEGRRRYLEHQRMCDGLLMSAAVESGVQPQHIVEDIADALLDDLLAEEAADMLKLCDEVAEQMYDNEFA